MQLEAFQAYKTYRQLFSEFLEQSSIHGLKIFLLSVSARYAKKLWLAFITLVIIWTHFVIGNLTLDYLQQPTELHMSTNMVHIGNGPFPGIAICSANKISRRKLSKYAEKIFHAQQSYQPNLLARSASELAEHLVSLTGFFLHAYYDFEPNDVRLERLHNIFVHMYNTTNYPSRDILHSLAPDCEDLVVRALVLGEHVNVTDFFVKRTTSSSVCCMFNYRRKGYSWNETRRYIEDAIARRADSLKIESNSLLNSVQIVAQYDEKDFTYKDLNNDAFQVNIFPNEDYASVQSSTVGELLLGLNTVMEIPIKPRFFTASSSIGSFSPKIRKCYFPSEGEKLFNISYYSIDECLLLCRIQSMIKYCGCVAPSMLATKENLTYCNFMDLACLTKWKGVWYGSNYFDYVYAGTEKMKSSYEVCDECLPTCNGVEFDIDVTTLPLRRAHGSTYKGGILQVLLAGLSNDKPLSIVKFYFKERYAQETIEDVVADWVLLLNRFGGILSLMYGFSIISYIEIFYFLSGKWFFHMRARTPKILNYPKHKESKKSKNVKGNVFPEAPPYLELYWHELNPKRAKLGAFRESSDLHL